MESSTNFELTAKIDVSDLPIFIADAVEHKGFDINGPLCFLDENGQALAVAKILIPIKQRQGSE